ncbi:ferredoxin-type protein NapF [Endothiovibrio diazotrophicus]
MGGSISRAQFLRGDFQGHPLPLRPPWSIAEPRFIERCTRCGDCLRACPAGILQAGRGGFPEVDFSRGECTFCDRCATACARGVIDRSDERLPWQAVAVVDDRCLALRGVVCRSCGERCPEGAITFRMVVGGAALPQLELAACSGCGACVAPCPVGAVAIRRSEVNP